MGKPRPQEKALLFIATLYSENGFFIKAEELLKKEFGEVLFESKPFPWDYSEYYRDELGWPINRQFLAFKKMINPETIREIKLFTNNLEEILSDSDKRKINLDPGYVTLSKVVLATTKNYAHRIYIGKGIYTEVTLFYKNKSFRPHEFTYKDYQSPEYINFFKQLREYL